MAKVLRWRMWARLVTKLCLTLCDPMDYSPPGPSVQARILEWVAISFSTGSSGPRYRTRIYVTSIVSRFSSVQFSRSIMSNSLRPHGPQHTRPPCPSPTPGVYPNSCPLSQWCHSAISSSVIPFSSCLQSFPTSESFQKSTSGGQSIGVLSSPSVLPMNIQDCFPLRWTGWTSLQSKGLSRVFSNTTVQKHQFFSAQLSL